MVLPLRLLWTLRISRKQKMGLACLFSLGIIVIIFAFIRLSNVTKATSEAKANPTTIADGPILLSLWSTIEAAVAVIVANLPAFRSLLRTRGNTRNEKYSGSSLERGATGYSAGSHANTSRSAIKRPAEIELESLHSNEDADIFAKASARQLGLEADHQGRIVITNHVAVASRQIRDDEHLGIQRSKLGLAI